MADPDRPFEPDERIEEVEVEEPSDENEGYIVFKLIDGRKISAPLSWSWRLQQAEPDERQNYRIGPGGYRVRWPDVDEDLTVHGLLNGAPAKEPEEVDETDLASDVWPPAEIIRLREALDLTQKEFADKLGVRRQATISDWENGNQEPSPMALRLLDKLNARLERRRSQDPDQETKTESGESNVTTYHGPHEKVVDQLNLGE